MADFNTFSTVGAIRLLVVRSRVHAHALKEMSAKEIPQEDFAVRSRMRPVRRRAKKLIYVFVLRENQFSLA